ncbi:MAG: LPS export ABC transporter periplasmic protein LptC [Armatimonadota bacterium]
MPKVRCRLIVTLLAVGICMALLAGCPGSRQGKRPRNGTPPKKTATGQPANQDEKGRIIIHGPYEIVYPPQGPRVFVAKVQSGQGTSAANDTFTLTGIDCQMYKDGVSTLKVTADSGKAMFKGKQVFVKLTGKVHAKEPKRGFLLDADTLHWSADTNKITASEVVWRGNGFEHTADSGKFTTDLSEGEFSGHVRTESFGSRL